MNEELSTFKKAKQDEILAAHIEVMKAAGRVTEETNIEALMEELRNISDESLAREAELLTELASAKKDVSELSDKPGARKTKLSKGASSEKAEKDLVRRQVYEAFGAEDLLDEKDTDKELSQADSTSE